MHLSTGLFVSLIRWTSRSAISSALALLAAGVALGIVGTYEYASEFELLRGFGWSGKLSALLIAGFAIGVFWWSRDLANRRVPLNPVWYLIGLMLVGTALHLLLITTVTSSWGTDHLRYWQYAQKLVAQGEYGGMDRPYYSRSLFVPYPIIKLFGPEAKFALKLANVALLGATQLALYDIMRRFASHQIAQSTSLLFLAAPLPVYATLIPAHDLWGLFFMTAAFWAFACSIDISIKGKSKWSIAAWIFAAIASGLLAYLAEVQRSLGLILCASILLSCVLYLAILMPRTGQPKRQNSGLLVAIALITLSSYMAFDILDEKIKLRADDRPVLMNMKFSANAGGMGNGKSDFFARFRSRFGEGYETPERSADLLQSIGLSSWANAPADRATALAVHSQRLFSMTYPRDWNWMLRHTGGISDRTREGLVFYSDVYGALFGIFLLVCTLKLALRRSQPPVVVTCGAIFIVALALPLLLVFENKPYNIFPIWLIGSMIIGYAVRARFLSTADGIEPVPSVQRLSGNPIIGAVALLVITSVTIPLFIRSAYTVSDGRILEDWSLSTNQSGLAMNGPWRRQLIDARPEAFDVRALAPLGLDEMYLRSAQEDGDRIRKYAGHNVSRIEFPAPYKQGDEVTLSTQVCTTDPERNQLEFFLYSPKDRTSGRDLSLAVLVDNRKSNAFEIPLRGRNFQRFVLTRGLADHACHEVGFRLRATSDAGKGATPFVEVWLPRLIRDSAKS